MYCHPAEEEISLYRKNLARVCKSEESIGGLPVSMDGFCLSDKEHRSIKPLNPAYKAVWQTVPLQDLQALQIKKQIYGGDIRSVVHKNNTVFCKLRHKLDLLFLPE